MKLFAILLNILYLSLMLFACIRSNKWKQISNLTITAGCIALAAYTIISILRNVILLEILGMILISIGALLNGKKQGEINPIHHIIRAVIELVIVVLLII